MFLPLLFALTTIASFFALARMAVRTPPRAFRVVSSMMLWTGALIGLANVAAGAGIVAAVLFARRLAPGPVPATVPAWFQQD